MTAQNPKISGHCYCNAIRFTSSVFPLSVLYCHCDDCRRALGAPMAAFAEFHESDVVFDPSAGKRVEVNAGAMRSFCFNCGSSIAGWYGYLPGKIYIALGIINEAGNLKPALHAHDHARLPWLVIDDHLPRSDRSARQTLNSAD